MSPGSYNMATSCLMLTMAAVAHSQSQFKSCTSQWLPCWPSTREHQPLWDPALGEVPWLLLHGGMFLPSWGAWPHRCRVTQMSSTVGEDVLVAVLVRLSKAGACTAGRGSLLARQLSQQLKASPWASCSLPTVPVVTAGPCSS